ncbi:unnamed protein product, partial [Amoebophrya sp. A25]
AQPVGHTGGRRDLSTRRTGTHVFSAPAVPHGRAAPLPAAAERGVRRRNAGCSVRAALRPEGGGTLR